MEWMRAGCLIVIGAMLAAGQAPPPPSDNPDSGQQAPLLTPDQLDNLVAPVALYPDSLLSQVLVASTYPIEVVEAQQWVQQHRNLQGQQLVDAARDQNWDSSIQALVAFPDVLARLNQDIRWTTDLGNAFLAQQNDVMDAVQRMRQRAQQNGKLQSNSQETVQTQTQDGQSAITIEPANPQVVYVPTYDPVYIWGPPVYGVYPPLYYPPLSVGFTFGPGIYIGALFGGCCGWGEFGWGWGPSWFDRRIVVNNYFLHRYGFRDFHGGAFRDHEVWTHEPVHRLGVPYPNRQIQNRFRGETPPRGVHAAPPAGRFGTPQFERQNPGANRSVFGGIHDGGRTRIENDHGFSTMRPGGGVRSAPPAARPAPAPRSAPAPRGRGGRGH